ncbi:hypothetical protein GCM10027089_58880 [Nocardia thraciensis]
MGQRFDRLDALLLQDNRSGLPVPDIDRQEATVTIGRTQPEDSLPPWFLTVILTMFNSNTYHAQFPHHAPFQTIGDDQPANRTSTH